jgi:hypothetical protein
MELVTENLQQRGSLYDTMCYNRSCRNRALNFAHICSSDHAVPVAREGGANVRATILPWFFIQSVNYSTVDRRPSGRLAALTGSRRAEASLSRWTRNRFPTSLFAAPSWTVTRICGIRCAAALGVPKRRRTSCTRRWRERSSAPISSARARASAVGSGASWPTL